MIISNTTPLINFAEMGRMEVLAALFGTLVIPPAVADELNPSLKEVHDMNLS